MPQSHIGHVFMICWCAVPQYTQASMKRPESVARRSMAQSYMCLRVVYNCPQLEISTNSLQVEDHETKYVAIWVFLEMAKILSMIFSISCRKLCNNLAGILQVWEEFGYRPWPNLFCDIVNCTIYHTIIVHNTDSLANNGATRMTVAEGVTSIQSKLLSKVS